MRKQCLNPAPTLFIFLDPPLYFAVKLEKEKLELEAMAYKMNIIIPNQVEGSSPVDLKKALDAVSI